MANVTIYVPDGLMDVLRDQGRGFASRAVRLALETAAADAERDRAALRAIYATAVTGK